MKEAEVGVLYVYRKGEMRNEETFYSENVMGRVKLGDFNIDERISIKWTLKYEF